MNLLALRIRHSVPLAEQLETDDAKRLIEKGAKLYTKDDVTVLSVRPLVDFQRVSIHVKTPTTAALHVAA